MKVERLTEENESLLPNIGAASPGAYLQIISWNVRSMLRQTDILQTKIGELKQDFKEAQIAAAELDEYVRVNR